MAGLRVSLLEYFYTLSLGSGVLLLALGLALREDTWPCPLSHILSSESWMTVPMDNYSVFFRLVLSNGLLFRSSLFSIIIPHFLPPFSIPHTKHGAVGLPS